MDSPRFPKRFLWRSAHKIRIVFPKGPVRAKNPDSILHDKRLLHIHHSTPHHRIAKEGRPAIRIRWALTALVPLIPFSGSRKMTATDRLIARFFAFEMAIKRFEMAINPNQPLLVLIYRKSQKNGSKSKLCLILHERIAQIIPI